MLEIVGKWEGYFNRIADYMGAKNITKRDIVVDTLKVVGAGIGLNSLAMAFGCGAKHPDLSEWDNFKVLDYYFKYKLEHHKGGLTSAPEHFVTLKVPGYGTITHEKKNDPFTMAYLPSWKDTNFKMSEGDRAFCLESIDGVVIDRAAKGGYWQYDEMYVPGSVSSGGWVSPTESTKKQIKSDVEALLREARNVAIKELTGKRPQ